MSAADEAFVLVGPNAIRGPGVVDDVLACAAFESIDDRLAIADDCVLPTEQVWRRAMCSAVGARSSAVVVHPSWWTPRRCSLATGALVEEGVEVVTRDRAEVLRTDETRAVVEIADDFVVVHQGNAPRAVILRADRGRGACAIVVEGIVGAARVVIDAPSGVAGARELSEEIACSLRLRSMPVSIYDDDAVLRAVQADWTRRPQPVRPTRRLLSRCSQPRVAVLAVAVASVVALAGAASGSDAGTPAPRAWVWVVEGRVAVEVPADWKVDRVTTGPGSARLQVVSPSEPRTAIHVTQSMVPMQQSLQTAADVLVHALSTQPSGVFVAFKMADRRVDRPVITYQEVRADHRVDWTVLLDGGMRIAIGCQRAPDRPGAVDVCDRAVRSARALA